MRYAFYGDLKCTTLDQVSVCLGPFSLVRNCKFQSSVWILDPIAGHALSVAQFRVTDLHLDLRGFAEAVSAKLADLKIFKASEG